MKKFIIIYGVLVHLFIALLITKTDFFKGLSSSLGYAQTNPLVSHYINNMYKFQQQLNLQIPAQQNFLVGDSIAKSLAATNLNASVINWGIGHNNTELLLNNLDNLDSLYRAEKIVINIGINDLNGNKPLKDIFKRYTRIIEKLDKVPNIYIVSILPMSTERHNSTEINGLVRELNSMLEEYAATSSRVNFIDLYARMSIQQALNPIYDRGDGLHINARGYQFFTQILNEVVFDA